MSKFQPLWDHVAQTEMPLKLSFDEIATILGFPIDHSFLRDKKQLGEYGLTVKKISLKEQFVIFDRL